MMSLYLGVGCRVAHCILPQALTTATYCLLPTVALWFRPL